MVAIGDDDVVIPVLFLQRIDDLLLLRRLANDLRLAVVSDLDLLATLCQHAAPSFFIERSRPGPCAIKIGLVALDDPLLHFLAAILHAGIAADNLKLQPQLKIADFALSPDEKGVSLRRLLGSGLAGNRAVFDAPEVRVAIPALERLAVEEGRKAGLVFGEGGNGNERKQQQNPAQPDNGSSHERGSKVAAGTCCSSDRW